MEKGFFERKEKDVSLSSSCCISPDPGASPVIEEEKGGKRGGNSYGRYSGRIRSMPKSFKAERIMTESDQKEFVVRKSPYNHLVSVYHQSVLDIYGDPAEAKIEDEKKQEFLPFVKDRSRSMLLQNLPMNMASGELYNLISKEGGFNPLRMDRPEGIPKGWNHSYALIFYESNEIVASIIRNITDRDGLMIRGYRVQALEDTPPPSETPVSTKTSLDDIIRKRSRSPPAPFAAMETGINLEDDDIKAIKGKQPPMTKSTKIEQSDEKTETTKTKTLNYTTSRWRNSENNNYLNNIVKHPRYNQTNNNKNNNNNYNGDRYKTDTIKGLTDFRSASPPPPSQ